MVGGMSETPANRSVKRKPRRSLPLWQVIERMLLATAKMITAAAKPVRALAELVRAVRLLIVELAALAALLWALGYVG